MILEKDVKRGFLECGRPVIDYDLGGLGKCEVNFEQYLIKDYLRADVTIWSENKGLIGIEIKNEHDDLRRLNRQLLGYVSTCNYVYVLTHPKHLKSVLKKTKDKPYVGILVYNNITPKEITIGVYRSAELNPKFDILLCMRILWKPELERLLTANYGHQRFHMTKASISIRQYDSLRKSIFHGRNPTKKGLIYAMVKLFGKRKCLRLITDTFVTDTYSSHRHLQEQIWK